MNIQFCFSRRGYTMKKCDILLPKGFLYLFKGYLLNIVERVGEVCFCEGCSRFSTSSVASGFLECFFVFRFHCARESRFHHVAQWADIIVCNPLPKGDLLFVYDGTLIQQFQNTFHFYSHRLVVVCLKNHTCVYLLFAKRHNNSTASHHLSLHLGRNEVCEAVEWYREYDVCKHQLLIS